MKPLLTLIICMVGCSHKKDGMIVKDAQGNIYRLEQAAQGEAYWLNKLNTIEIKRLLEVERSYYHNDTIFTSPEFMYDGYPVTDTSAVKTFMTN